MLAEVVRGVVSRVPGHSCFVYVTEDMCFRQTVACRGCFKLTGACLPTGLGLGLVFLALLLALLPPNWIRLRLRLRLSVGCPVACLPIGFLCFGKCGEGHRASVFEHLIDMVDWLPGAWLTG